MEHRAVRRVAAVPAIPLDATLEALALRDADDIDQLTRREHLDGERLADLIALDLLGLLEPDLADHLHRGHVRLLEDTGRGLRHVLLLRAEAELQRIVAVRLRRPDPDDRARPRLDDRHRHMTPIISKHLRHPNLPPNKPLLPRHRYPRRPCVSRPFPASRGRSNMPRCEALERGLCPRNPWGRLRR